MSTTLPITKKNEFAVEMVDGCSALFAKLVLCGGGFMQEEKRAMVVFLLELGVMCICTHDTSRCSKKEDLDMSGFHDFAPKRRYFLQLA